MATILSVSGSPSATSRTLQVLRHVEARLAGHGHVVRSLAVRDLPASSLLAADVADPAISAAVEAIAAADGLVVATPVYKASYTGLLKALLDLLPQFGLASKVVLPLATGGSIAHVLAIDYALRPVLTSLGADHVVQGYFVLDRLLTPTGDGSVAIAPDAEDALFGVVDRFSAALRVSAPLVRAS